MEYEVLDDNALSMRTLELAQMDEDDDSAYTIFKDLRPIIRGSREAHKADVTTADTDTESLAETAVCQSVPSSKKTQKKIVNVLPRRRKNL